MADGQQQIAALLSQLGRMGVVPILIELLREASKDPRGLQTLSAPPPAAPAAPAPPDRWLTTTRMALRLRRSPSALLKLRASEQGQGLRALTRSPGGGKQRPRLRWPERAVLAWWAENRPEEIEEVES